MFSAVVIGAPGRGERRAAHQAQQRPRPPPGRLRRRDSSRCGCWTRRAGAATSYTSRSRSCSTSERRSSPWRATRGCRLVHHSDRGVQYTALSFGKRLEEASIVPSMGRAGSALDNAISESFVSTLKCELVHRRRFPTREAARTAIFEYLEAFYNRRRLHSSLVHQTVVNPCRRTVVSQVCDAPQGPFLVGRFTLLSSSTPEPSTQFKRAHLAHGPVPLRSRCCCFW